MKLKYLMLSLLVLSIEAQADDSTLDAAIGGAIGGATGAAVGHEIGGRDGAIVGGALGAAIGTAVNTKEGSVHEQAPAPVEVHYEQAPPRSGHPHEYHCPPGQRKKNRC